MSEPARTKLRETRFLLRDFSPPEQIELEALSNALHAALGYSPMTVASEHHDDVHAYVTRQVQERFWTDIYVDRPEIRDILFQLDKGQLVIITGERGTGKSTALQAAVHALSGGSRTTPAEPSPGGPGALVIVTFDANEFTADLHDPDAAATLVRTTLFHRLVRDALEGGMAWMAFLYEHAPEYEALQMSFVQDGFAPNAPDEWVELASMPEYTDMLRIGTERFTNASDSARLRLLLQFIGERTHREPLLVIDNVDHLANDVQCRCAEVLFEIIESNKRRVKGAIAIRPENLETIQHSLDTAMRSPEVSMVPRTLRHEEFTKPSIDLTLAFIERRVAVLQEPDTVAVVLNSIDRAKATRLAEAIDPALAGNVDAFLDTLLELLQLMVYDIFGTDEDDPLSRDNWDFARAIHAWHNGSLRDCGVSVTSFASDILQNKTHMYELRTLLQSVVATRGDKRDVRRRKLRRFTRSLLYRHLLFWGKDHMVPAKNVMVFDGTEETTDPPIHFLRLRILQHLAHRHRHRGTVRTVRREMGKLGVPPARIDEALRELAAERTPEDAGLIRIDRLGDQEGEDLHDGAQVQLLDAGKFLVDTLYVTTEYLFWSALSSPVAAAAVGVRGTVTSEDMQSDGFRAMIAARFVDRYLVRKFRDEHPYLDGVPEGWTHREARQRLLLYGSLFGFSRGSWFLDRCCDSMTAFIGSSGREGEFREAREAITHVRGFASMLDAVVESPGRHSRR
jgi:energy-coupling factor transporter ATP-binding protein EcfA2